MFSQRKNLGVDSGNSGLSYPRVILVQIVAYAFEVVGCDGCPAEAHSALEHSFKASVHLCLINKLSPIRALKPSANPSAYPSVLIDHAKRRVNDHLAGILTQMRRQAAELCFLLGTEGNFHGQD